MNLKDLQDLIAFAEAGSLTAAAARRHVTQPAYLRRVRALEETLGMVLATRETRPARPTVALLQALPNIKALAYSLEHLRRDLTGGAPVDRVLKVAALHTIAVADIPRLLPELETTLPYTRLDLEAADRDECFALLMTGRASIALIYESAETHLLTDEELVARKTLRTDTFRAYLSAGAALDEAALAHKVRSGEVIPLIEFWPSRPLGRMLHSEVLPRSPARFRAVAGSHFASAVQSMCLAGTGVAWLPENLARPHVAAGQLVPLADVRTFPTLPLQLVMMRLRRRLSAFDAGAWRAMETVLSA